MHKETAELQRQNKLISSERPSKSLQNETKIIKIGQAILELFNFKNLALDSSPKKNYWKQKMLVFFRSFAQTEEQ